MSHISKMRFSFFISVLGPMLLMTLGFVAYLTYTLGNDKIDHEKSYNDIIESVLVEESKYALNLGGYSQLQLITDGIVKNHEDHIHSIELIDDQKKIVVSSPAEPDVSLSAIRIPLYVQTPSNDNDLFDMESNEADSKQLGGYLIIRNNPSYIEKSFTDIIFMLVVILAITGLGGLIVLVRLRKQYFMPHKVLIDSLEDVTRNQLNIKELSILDPDLKGLVMRLDNLLTSLKQENTELRDEVKVTLSSVDAANIDRIELLAEMVRGVDRGLNEAREKIASIASQNNNEELKQDIKYLMKYLESTHTSLNNTKTLLDQPVIDSDTNVIVISNFCSTLVDTVSSHNKKVLCGKIINPELNNAYIALDDKHFEKLICSVIDLASHVSNNSEIQLSIGVKNCLENKSRVSIVINIEDSCHGMPLDEDIKLNNYLNNKTSSISSNYFVIEDLKKIKYLSGLPHLSFTFNPVYGRGNNYNIIIDCDYSDKIDDLVIENKPHTKSVAIVNGNASIKENVELFRQLNINVTYYNSKDSITSIETLSNNEVIIIDFTKNQKSMLSLCKYLKELEYKGRIITAVTDKLLDDDVIDQLNMMGLTETMPAHFLPNTLKKYVLEDEVKQFSVSDYLNSQKDNK